MKKELKLLLGVSIFLLFRTSAYSQTGKMTNRTDQEIPFSKQTLEKFEDLRQIKNIEKLIHSEIRSQKVPIFPFKNNCSFKSLGEGGIISELDPLDYIIYFESNEIRKTIFLSLTQSDQLSSRSKAFIVSQFITGLFNQDDHDVIRELLRLEVPTPTRANAVQKYLQCLFISGDQKNLRDLYNLATVVPEGTDLFRLLSEEETLFPVLVAMINDFFRSSEVEFSKSRIYPPFKAFVQAFDPASPASIDNFRGTATRHWFGSDLLEKAVNQVLETGAFSSTRKILESKQRFDDQIERILKTSQKANFLTSSGMSSSTLGKRSAESLLGSTDEHQTLGHQTFERIAKKQPLTRDQNAEKFEESQNQLLDPRVNHGSYEIRGSEWLSSLGIMGQNGLYTNTDLPAEKTILTYSGKIYDSEEALFEVFPEDTWDERRETDYLLDVRNEDGEILYIVSGLETEDGETPSFACLINHTVPELANVEFKNIPNANAHKGYEVVVVTKKPIRAGTELKVFYGEELHEKILEKNPQFKKFVEEKFPNHLLKKPLNKKGSSQKRRISSHSSLTRRICRLTNPNQLLNRSSSRQSGRETSEASSEFLALLDLSDQLFREASTYSKNSQFEKAFNQLAEAITQLQSGFNLISEQGHPASQNQVRTLKYNLNYRLADLYWELARNSLSLSQHLPELPRKLKYSYAQVHYYKRAQLFYSKQQEESLDSEKNQKAAEYREELARKRIHELSKNPTQVIQEDSNVSYETAFDLKEKADHLVKLEKTRKEAVSWYELALRYIQSEENGILDHGYHQYLEADLNWSLGEVYQEDSINHIQKSKKLYERAILLYQNLLESHSGISETDLKLILEDVEKHLGLARSALESLREVEIFLNSHRKN